MSIALGRYLFLGQSLMSRLRTFAALSILIVPVRALHAESPALEFFDTAASVVEENYYAAPGVDVAGVLASQRSQLQRRCAGQEEPCTVEQGIEAATQAVAGFNDAHARIQSPPPRPVSATTANTPPPRGPVAPVNPLGWALRQAGKQGPLYVSWVAPGGPAEKAGLRRHDLVTSPSELSAAALSAAADSTRIAWKRGAETFEAVLVPDRRLQGPTPKLEMIQDIAILQFPLGAGEGIGESAHALVREAKNRNAKAIVLDLRDNPGGGIQCAAMAGAFLDYSVQMRDRAGVTRTLTVNNAAARMVEGDDVEEVKVAEPARWDGPLAILVNKNTGSCAESVAIQASLARRATIVGESSVGVGNNVVQPFPLPAGRQLVLPVAYSFTPSGEPLPPRPALDIAVSDDVVEIGRSGRDAVLDAGIAALRSAKDGASD